MKRILLDTNIILDVILERQPFVKNAVKLIELSIGRNDRLFITASTITDIYYIAKRRAGHNTTIQFIKELLGFIDVVAIDKVTVINALNNKMSDFEDAIQTEAARQNRIHILIARNIKDFDNLEIEVLLPEDYIDKLNKENF